jgi:hypothetical protein
MRDWGDCFCLTGYIPIITRASSYPIGHYRAYRAWGAVLPRLLTRSFVLVKAFNKCNREGSNEPLRAPVKIFHCPWREPGEHLVMENEGSTELSSEARHVIDGTGKELSVHVLCRCSKLQDLVSKLELLHHAWMSTGESRKIEATWWYIVSSECFPPYIAFRQVS